MERTVTSLLVAAVERAAGLQEGHLRSAILASKLQLWGAAIPLNHWTGANHLYDATHKIGVAGDWISVDGVGASTVEGAWRSGRSLAEHIADPLRRSVHVSTCPRVHEATLSTCP